jgi:methylated-DNA-[protein]-cysteine S-methyltransferase
MRCFFVSFRLLYLHLQFQNMCLCIFAANKFAMISISYSHTSIGEIILGSYNNSLCLCDWRYRSKRAEIDRRLQGYLGCSYKVCESETNSLAVLQVHEYLAASRQVFSLPLMPLGTAFQLKVWDALMLIPYGARTSYSALATEIGAANAVRAAASAIGANAISFFIPCHRVLASNGALTGYAGGIAAKRKMLSVEHSLLQHRISGF